MDPRHREAPVGHPTDPSGKQKRRTPRWKALRRAVRRVTPLIFSKTANAASRYPLWRFITYAISPPASKSACIKGGIGLAKNSR